MGWSMRDEAPISRQSDERRRERLRLLISEYALTRGGSYQLASGKSSSYFFDMKPVVFDPEGSRLIADAILDLLEGERVDYVGGLEMGAVPIAAIVVERSFERTPVGGFFVRKAAKERGTRKLIEGNLEPGSTAVLVEDVTTTGGSVLHAAEAVRELGCTVTKVVTVVDRLEGAGENLSRHGLELVSLFTVDDFPE
jgi:orotate phosphoribosyltransferase